MQGIQGERGPAGADGQGVPTGGTTGQVLAKTSGTNYATAWVTPTGGGSGAWYDSGPRNLATALAIRVQRVDGTVTVAANNGAGSYSPGSANGIILPAGTLPVGMRPKYAENTFIFSASPANTPFIFRVNPDGSISVHSYGPTITITYGACTLSFAPASLAIPASMPGTPG